MNKLQEWAARWAIPAPCLADLLQSLGVVASPPAADPRGRTSEAFVQSLVRLEAPRHNVMLFRNNVGVLTNQDGRPVRYGLANDSKATNETFKSGDLIGWRPVTITAAMTGSVIAQFISRECKAADWKWSGDAHEIAQLAWASMVTRDGGDARFVTGEGSFE